MRYHVDAAELASASARAGQSAAAIRAEVAGMMAQLVALEGAWQGSAAMAFAGVRDQWQGAQLHVEEALDAITSALAVAAQSYEEAETHATRLFGR
ncbi:WXG100 family type VII secretion target [Demequina pelophila]|uniref:WXG100 family type VII secretion target n=1 Tax=Demequina pelophila TaxID=1638984 RepID=UPI000780BA3A|nr:WXG100 family type VII secretion target [Demequina pelophila]